MSRKLIFSTGEYYHLYNRGVDKRIIFENEQDRDRFISLLYLCNGDEPVHLTKTFNESAYLLNERGSASFIFSYERGTPLVAIGAYCLMTNHFHLLIREISEGGISIFMHKLSTAYTMYFNTSRERSGSLFQGRFRAEHAQSDKYLKYLFSYIHLNPIKIIDPEWKIAGLESESRTRKLLSTYKHSSYLDYLKPRKWLSNILKFSEFPDYFSTKSDFKKEIFDWLYYKNKTTD